MNEDEEDQDGSGQSPTAKIQAFGPFWWTLVGLERTAWPSLIIVAPSGFWFLLLCSANGQLHFSLPSSQLSGPFNLITPFPPFHPEIRLHASSSSAGTHQHGLHQGHHLGTSA